ncbi:Lrp/AsnC family transcriptional regulator [Maricaulis sp.]|uniref:Lrp/AsnC family transcriptional regulator n=1 Tax=Maricaulis sp. TaxID=1486257 RepID=UPI001B174A5D|nr:Lrp/AsnC family transcriptional regulator [Maricaulis sp.]MBO6796986.1 Lrp/AsnC family transcriptional regulator [Maricaulis sp.]
MRKLDQYDRSILRHLQRDGRMSIVDLAERVGLSKTPTQRRVKMLEDDGLIEHYAAVLDPASLGLNFCVWVMIRLGKHRRETVDEFLAAVAKNDAITECCLVTGGADYMLRVHARDIKDYRDFMMADLVNLPGVTEVTTHVVLDEPKTRSSLPLPTD